RQPLIQQIGCTHGRSRHLRTLRGRWRRTRGHRWFGRWRGGRSRRLTLLGSSFNAGEALLEIRDLLIERFGARAQMQDLHEQRPEQDAGDESRDTLLERGSD